MFSNRPLRFYCQGWLLFQVQCVLRKCKSDQAGDVKDEGENKSTGAQKMFYLCRCFAVQRNCYHLFPVGRGCWSSLCGTKPMSVAVKPPLYLAFFLLPDTHHFLRALWTGVGRLSGWPAQDRGKEQNEDNSHFHCVTALCLDAEKKQAGWNNTVTTYFFSTIKREGITFVDDTKVLLRKP